MKPNKKMMDCKSYYDRDNKKMEIRVSKMLRDHGFGLDWGEKGDFLNLDGIPIEPEFER